MGYKSIGLVVMLLTPVHVTGTHAVGITVTKSKTKRKKKMNSLVPRLKVQSTQKLKDIYFMPT